MPSAPKRPCAQPGCPELVSGTPRCSAHARQHERTSRGTSSERGYNSAWRQFRTWFAHQLIKHGIAPVCGASLPHGPDMSGISACRDVGLLTDQHLELHHEPPLTDIERTNPKAVCDPRRVAWLCPSCHAKRTRQAENLMARGAA